MQSRKFAGFSAALLALCILMVGSLLLLRPLSPLRARPTSVSPLVAFAPAVPDADLRRPATDARRRPRVRATPTGIGTTTGSTLPLIESLNVDLDLLPGGALLQTELPELSEASLLGTTIGLRGLDYAAEGFNLYPSPLPQVRTVRFDRRPDSLRPLYASFAALQTLDAYSTWRVLRTGKGRELNPALRGVADNLPALLVVKGATTASSVYLSERLWKRNPSAAVVTMVGINAAYGLLVVRNFRVNAAVR